MVRKEYVNAVVGGNNESVRQSISAASKAHTHFDEGVYTSRGHK